MSFQDIAPARETLHWCIQKKTVRSCFNRHLFSSGELVSPEKCSFGAFDAFLCFIRLKDSVENSGTFECLNSDRIQTFLLEINDF